MGFSGALKNTVVFSYQVLQLRQVGQADLWEQALNVLLTVRVAVHLHCEVLGQINIAMI
jgi:hypothetical protein